VLFFVLQLLSPTQGFTYNHTMSAFDFDAALDAFQSAHHTNQQYSLLSQVFRQLNQPVEKHGQPTNPTPIPTNVLTRFTPHFLNTSPRFVLAQINTQPGNLQGNAQAIGRQIAIAQAIGIKCIAFPELALMGYPIGDIVTRFPFLVEENLKWLTALAKQCTNITALVGFVEPTHPFPITDFTNLQFYNSVAVLQNGTVERVIRKALLPHYNEFYDPRTFKPATISAVSQISGHEEVSPIVTLKNLTVGLSICEDIWNDPDFFSVQRYDTNPIESLISLKPDCLLNLSASPSRSRKEAIKHQMLSHVASKYQTPVLYVNQVGAVDELSFDGASRVYDSHGQLIARAASFAEDWLILDSHFAPTTDDLTIAPLPAGTTTHYTSQKTFDPNDTSDLARTYQTLVQGISDYFEKTGFQKALLGLSGGLDSSVTAVLLADALGPDNVLGVLMPSGLTSSDSDQDARSLAHNLGITHIQLPITEPVNSVLTLLTPAVNQLKESHWATPNPYSFAQDNVQAMNRALILRLLGNEFNALPIATSDKSELYLGYATVNGDMSGALAPLGDVPKTKVRQLAYWINTHRPVSNVLPETVMTKAPGAELAINPETGKPLTAEDALMPYAFCDEIIWRIETLHQSYTEMLNTPFFYEVQHPIPQHQKQHWLDRFFKRMSAAVFKWWLLPPTIMVEGNGSITKTDYRHPIVANRIAWQGHTERAIESLLTQTVGNAENPLSLSNP